MSKAGSPDSLLKPLDSQRTHADQKEPYPCPGSTSHKTWPRSPLRPLGKLSEPFAGQGRKGAVIMTLTFAPLVSSSAFSCQTFTSGQGCTSVHLQIAPKLIFHKASTRPPGVLSTVKLQLQNSRCNWCLRRISAPPETAQKGLEWTQRLTTPSARGDGCTVVFNV